jgi:hypothetical protein
MYCRTLRQGRDLTRRHAPGTSDVRDRVVAEALASIVDESDHET